MSISDILTSLIQGMGANNLLTILVTYQNSSNGTWNTIAREATGSSTGVLTGAAGDFASFLSFDVSAVPEPAGALLCGVVTLGTLMVSLRRAKPLHSDEMESGIR